MCESMNKRCCTSIYRTEIMNKLSKHVEKSTQSLVNFFEFHSCERIHPLLIISWTPNKFKVNSRETKRMIIYLSKGGIKKWRQPLEVIEKQQILASHFYDVSYRQAETMSQLVTKHMPSVFVFVLPIFFHLYQISIFSRIKNDYIIFVSTIQYI